jgi:hypothetical protein
MSSSTARRILILAGAMGAALIRGEPIFLARYFQGILFSHVIGGKLWAGRVPDRKTIDDIVDIFLNGVQA